ncbi:MAG: hypothetical protein ACWA6Y_05890 [Polaromonas sp.]
MKLINQSSRSAVVAGVAATLAVAVMGFAGAAQARDNVYWSVGVGTPGAVVNVGNSGYPQPVYVQPAPVYVQPAPVYVQPRPVYVQPRPVYVAPQPVYYERPRGHRRHGHGSGQYWRGYRDGSGAGYAPVYYGRDGGYDRDDRRHGDR